MTHPYTLELADKTTTDPNPRLTFTCTACGARPANLVTETDPPDDNEMVRCGACAAEFGPYGEVVEHAQSFGRQESAKRVQEMLRAAGIDITVEIPGR